MAATRQDRVPAPLRVSTLLRSEVGCGNRSEPHVPVTATSDSGRSTTGSPTHPPIHPPTQPPTNPPTHPPTHPSTHPPTHTHTHAEGLLEPPPPLCDSDRRLGALTPSVSESARAFPSPAGRRRTARHCGGRGSAQPAGRAPGLMLDPPSHVAICGRGATAARHSLRPDAPSLAPHRRCSARRSSRRLVTCRARMPSRPVLRASSSWSRCAVVLQPKLLTQVGNESSGRHRQPSTQGDWRLLEQSPTQNRFSRGTLHRLLDHQM
jgi:hypothetical protein